MEATQLHLLEKIIRQLDQRANIPTSDQREAAIQELLRAIDTGTFVQQGEELEIIRATYTEEVIGKIDRKIAETLGYAHRTVNAFVYTPNGQIVLQQRTDGRVYPLHLTIFGGHVTAGQSYIHAIHRELLEELNLGKEKLDNRPEFLKFHIYNIPTDNNNERSAIFKYQLSEAEYTCVLQEKERLEDAMKNKTRSEYTTWLDEAAKTANGEGKGEVWAIYFTDLDTLQNAAKAHNPQSKIGDGIVNNMEDASISLVDLVNKYNIAKK